MAIVDIELDAMEGSGVCVKKAKNFFENEEKQLCCSF